MLDCTCSIFQFSNLCCFIAFDTILPANKPFHFLRQNKKYRERELAYGATRSTDGLCATDYFSFFKAQMVDLTGQNIFHMKI
jgi:hypothetical protein